MDVESRHTVQKPANGAHAGHVGSGDYGREAVKGPVLQRSTGGLSGNFQAAYKCSQPEGESVFINVPPFIQHNLHFFSEKSLVLG